MKKLVLLGFLLALVMPLCAHAAWNVSYLDGKTYTTNAMTGYSTYGDMMNGMQVTAYYDGGGYQTVAWTTTGNGAGAAVGSGWSLVQSGDTYTAPWTLSSAGVTGAAGAALIGLKIFAAPGNTTFDVLRGTTGTEGSAQGWYFDYVSGFANGMATYSDLLAVNGQPAVGDLYVTLDLAFSGIFQNTSLVFIADTDNATTRIIPSPEPLTLLLLGLGLTGLAGLRKRD